MADYNKVKLHDITSKEVIAPWTVVEQVEGLEGKLAGLNTGVQGVQSEMNTKIAGVQGQLSTAIKGVQGQISGLQSDAEEELSGLQTRLEGVQTQLEGVQDAIETELKEDVVHWTHDGNRDHIVLKNHSMLEGTATATPENGGADVPAGNYNLAMVNKWNVADFGSSKLPINLNGSKDRPTYNDTKDIALMVDIKGVQGEFDTKIEGVQTDIDTIVIGVQGEVDEKLTKLKREILGEGVTDAFDTLKEVESWIGTHGHQYSDVLTHLNNIDESLETIEGDIKGVQGEADTKINTAITGVQKQISDLDEKVDGLQSDAEEELSGLQTRLQGVQSEAQGAQAGAEGVQTQLVGVQEVVESRLDALEKWVTEHYNVNVYYTLVED